jgi:hypothetical protein
VVGAEIETKGGWMGRIEGCRDVSSPRGLLRLDSKKRSFLEKVGNSVRYMGDWIE